MTLAAVSESVYYQIPISGYGDVDYHATLTQVQEVKAFIFNDFSRIFNLTLQHFENFIEHNHVLNSNMVHKIVNHPVHIIDRDGKLSPSAFIPFCELEGNMFSNGRKNRSV